MNPSKEDHDMHERETMNGTTSSRVYKFFLRKKLEKEEGKCAFCGLHRGENTRHFPHRSWKRYRVHQYD